MSLDHATFLLHTPEAERLHLTARPPNGRGTPLEFDALLIAQTLTQQLFITLEPTRRYVTAAQEPDSDERELAFVTDYEEVEALLETAGKAGLYDGTQGLLAHNLLFLLMNP